MCFIRKIKKRLLDDIAFVEFNCNLNFVLDDILPDVVIVVVKSIIFKLKIINIFIYILIIL